MNEIREVLKKTKTENSTKALAEYVKHASVEQLRDGLLYILKDHDANVLEYFEVFCTDGLGMISVGKEPEILQELLFTYATNLQMQSLAYDAGLLKYASFQQLTLALAENIELPVTNTKKATQEDHPLVRAFKEYIQEIENQPIATDAKLSLEDAELLLTVPFQNRKSQKQLYTYAEETLPFRSLTGRKIQALSRIIEAAPSIGEWLLDRVNFKTIALKNKKNRSVIYQLLKATLYSGDAIVFQKLISKQIIKDCIIDNRSDFDNPKQPILFVAAESPLYHTAIPILLQLGMSKTILNQNGENILQVLYCKYKENAAERIQDLIQLGIPADVVDQNGKTVLMLAAKEGDLTTVEILLKNGASPKKVALNNKTAEDYAAESGKPKVIQKLSASESAIWSKKKRFSRKH